MAIEIRYDGGRHHVLVCDHCRDEAGYFDDFYEAVAEKKNYGIHSVREYGEWKDYSLMEVMYAEHKSLHIWSCFRNG